jgi:hypothetical protein
VCDSGVIPVKRRQDIDDNATAESEGYPKPYLDSEKNSKTLGETPSSKKNSKTLGETPSSKKNGAVPLEGRSAIN